MATVSVELHVYSGRPNPKWEIDASHPLHTNVVQQLSGRNVGIQGQLVKVLGYRGFTAKIKDVEHVIPRATEHNLERLLLSTKPQEPTSVRGHDLITHILQSLPDEPRGKLKAVEKPIYEPEKWNTPTVQPNNNCYNYANNMITNTFAQPGRAHGYPTVEPITAEHVSFLAKKDGLIDVPAESPTELPMTDRNLVALVIWPDQDFHWYRQDASNLFSHKPGHTEVTNVDEHGDLIADPRHADRGEYTVFYGFMGTTQDTVNII